MMKFVLRIAALALMLSGLALWFWGGLNRGWTKTSVRTTRIEPVTGLEEQVWERRFVPGLDLLGAMALGAGAVFSLSFLIRKNES